ncbi:response regulator transcription factor [Cellulosilyticum ruminicola]|uniref:response regulator transcription factor n=1 Tax=Cellulosilyticum ruminicola TaxID=425254 RepID=UPI0006D257C4|nr:response regulator [Cellulosilyticum ruminicola]
MRVLIIDDEPNVREGLKVIVPWEEHGFIVCDTAEDGIDGLQKIMLLEPELVLVDIRIPGMMGIEVIEEAKKRGFKGKFIIITGYSEFEYAKRAINLGVSSYVLKPIDENELIEEVDKLVKEINKENEMRGKIDLGENYLHSQFLIKALTSKPEDLKKVLKDAYEDLDQQYEAYHIAILELESTLNRRSEVLEQITEYISNYEDISYVILNGEVVCIIQGENVLKIKDALIRLHKKLLNRYEIKNVISFSKGIKGFENMSSVYKNLKKMGEKRFLLPEKLIWEEENNENRVYSDKREIDAESISKQLYSLIQVGDKKRLKEEIKNIKVLLIANEMNINRAKGILVNILMKCLDYIRAQYAQYNIAIPNGEFIIETIYKCADIDEVLKYIDEELVLVCNQIAREAPENTMEKILYYIKNNYNKELRLEFLAELFNYNSAYLGKSFKNYTGESFNVYVDKLRIDKAKELLLNKDMRVYQISKEVGYKHIDYFHSKFKKYVGLSPLEYRKSIAISK